MSFADELRIISESGTGRQKKFEERLASIEKQLLKYYNRKLNILVTSFKNEARKEADKGKRSAIATCTIQRSDFGAWSPAYNEDLTKQEKRAIDNLYYQTVYRLVHQVKETLENDGFTSVQTNTKPNRLGSTILTIKAKW